MNRWPPMFESLTEEPAEKKMNPGRKEKGWNVVSWKQSKGSVARRRGSQLLNAAEILSRMKG